MFIQAAAVVHLCCDVLLLQMMHATVLPVAFITHPHTQKVGNTSRKRRRRRWQWWRNIIMKWGEFVFSLTMGSSSPPPCSPLSHSSPYDSRSSHSPPPPWPSPIHHSLFFLFPFLLHSLPSSFTSFCGGIASFSEQLRHCSQIPCAFLLQTCMLAQGLYVSTDSREPATGSLWGALMTELQKKSIPTMAQLQTCNTY